LAIVAVLWQARRFPESIVSPLSVFVLVQAGTMAISFLKMYRWMTDWHLATWIVHLVPLSLFVLGCFAASMIPHALAGPRPQELDRSSIMPFLRIEIFAIAYSLIAVVWAFKVAGRFPIFALDPETARVKFNGVNFFVGWGFNFNAIAIIGGLVLAIFFKRFLRWVGVFGVFVALGIQTLAGVRNLHFMAIVVGMSIWTLSKAAIRMRTLFAIMGAFSILFVLIALLRAQTLLLLIVMDMESLKAILLPIYSYAANCYWNLDYAVMTHMNTAFPHAWGIQTFGAFFTLGGISSGLTKLLLLEKGVMKVSGFNTLPYTWYLYQDGGVLFSGMVSVIWGFSMTRLFYWTRAKPDLGRTMIYSFLLFPIAMSFFTWYFNMLFFVVFIPLVVYMGTLAKTAKIDK
jgi:oligosaccharide repeat unit polymerase